MSNDGTCYEVFTGGDPDCRCPICALLEEKEHPTYEEYMTAMEQAEQQSLWFGPL